MNNQNLSKILLAFILLLFIATKWDALYLPYFWDEAWSYIPAISAMADQMPCLAPGCINPELYRGHPLFFYFLASVWMKWVSESLFSMHLFALLISILSIISFYRLGCLFLKPAWSLFSVALLLLQQIFYVQSSFVLPEVLIMLLTTETIRSYLGNRKLYFFICTALLGLTKETGLIILIGLALIHILFSKEKIRDSIWLYASFLPAIIFYSWQKIALGWFFYPLHQNLVDFSPPTLINKSKIILHFILIDQGRKMLIIILASLAAFFVLRKSKQKPIAFTPEEKRFFALVAFLFGLYFLFSISNFLMLRYLLFLFPLLVLTLCILFDKLMPSNRLLSSSICVLLFFNFLYSFIHTYKNRGWIDDAGINYLPMVEVHQDVAEYLQQDFATDERIFTHFLMYHNLKNADLGYVEENHEFEYVNYKDQPDPSDNIYILSGIEYNEGLHNMLKGNQKYRLLKRFEKNRAWSEVYIRSNNENN
jgi:hypothetical protein